MSPESSFNPVMIKEGTIKRLKVYARPDGTLLPNHREGARQPVDDDWWHGVLNDPRAYLPVTETSFSHDSRYAHHRLDRQRGDTVAFTCRCGRSRVISKAELIKAEGPSATVRLKLFQNHEL